MSEVEKIRAGVLFDKNSFSPVWFGLGKNKVQIKDILYKWVERKAGETVYKFSVSDGTDHYELHFSSFDMQWTLVVR